MPPPPTAPDPDAGRPRIRTVSSREVYRNPWLVLREDAIERPGGRPGVYAVVVKTHAAVVVPWDGTHVHLVGQHRHPLDRWSWELPQGAIDGAHDPPPSAEDVGRAELREETGMTAGRMVRLGELAFAPGISMQTFTAWLALDLVPGEPDPDPEEEGLIEPRAVTPAELDAMVDDGTIVDAATVATWHLARRHGLSGA